MTSPARHLGIAIARPAQEVYEFVREPSNLPAWASGLGEINQTQAGWIARTSSGSMRLRFAEQNDYGVLDHWVRSENGAEIYVPMRVIPSGDGSELMFTLLRREEMSAEQFEADARWVMRDLQALKALMEAAA